MSRPISIVEAVRLDSERKLADDFAAIIHDRHMRVFATPQEPLALDDCLDYEDHYGLAWAIVRHLFGPTSADHMPGPSVELITVEQNRERRP